MPEYKKKRINRIKAGPKRIKKSRLQKDRIAEDIKMTSDIPKKPAHTSEMKVVKGKKLEQKRKMKIVLIGLSLAAVILIILEVVLPTGIIETFGNVTVVLGSGSYPQSLDGTETLNTVSRGTYYYLLSDTCINAFSSSGKKIFSYTHGYENPMLQTSPTRSLIYDQGAKSAAVYNLRSQIKTITTDYAIITADIARNGTYAIATESDTNAATVSVYNKNGKLLYEWYSSTDMVNGLALSPNGKKLAVSTLNADGGKFKSNLYVLEYDSATPVYSETFDDTVVYSIDNTYNSGIAVVTKNQFEFISWSHYKKKTYSNEYSASMLRVGSGGYVVVFNRDNDPSDNRIAVFSVRGDRKGEFSYNRQITDIQISGGRIYCVSDTEAFLLDNSGNTARKSECGFGAVRIVPTGTYSAVIASDNSIEKIQFEEVSK